MTSSGQDRTDTLRIPLDYTPARSKAEATARMYYLGNRVVEPLGPGSKEKKSSLVALASFIGLDLSSNPGKADCGRAIADVVGTDWDESCFSVGDSITLAGMNRLLDGALRWHIRTGRQPVRSLIRDVLSVNPAPKWDDNTEESMSIDQSEVEQSIAELIAELASDGPIPDGVIVEADTGVDQRDVRFDDGSWRSALVRVQGWLHLADEIDASDDKAFDRSLSTLLGLDDSWVEADLLERLQQRVERATDLRTTFIEELESESEGGATLGTASSNWVASWDEAEEASESEDSGPIRAQADVWPIVQFQSKALQGELELSPSYQRADVWPTGDAQQLIESILRGIPLPSIIILERNTDDGGYYEIVDGKQRLTSILRFIGSHPKALAVVREKAKAWGVPDLETIFRSNYPAFKQLWKKHELLGLSQKTEREHFFPFALRASGTPMPLSGDLAQLRGKYYSEVKDIAIEVVNARRKISTIFEQMSDYRVPVIIYQEVSNKQVHEVFALYNKQGKHLNAEEIRNATYHQLDLMRALLVTAGDSSNVEEVAPFLVSDWDQLSSTGENLVSYGFADAGYKRTKVLSWVASTLLYEPTDARIDSMPTSKHINSFLRSVEEASSTGQRHPLQSSRTVASAMSMLDRSVDAHATLGDEAWAASFRNARGGKWQELQFVASLVALAAGAHVYDGDLADIAEEVADEILERSASWKRPSKTQSREQWQFISMVVAELLDILGVDVDAVDASLRKTYGSSGLKLLVDLRAAVLTQ